MAHWIKVEVSTPDKTEMRVIARECHCSRADAFLAFFLFFRFADTQTDDGTLPMLTAADVDDIAGLPGFANAMETVGWLTVTSTGFTVRNWDRHNGQSAKRRAINQARMMAVRMESAQKAHKCAH